MNEYITGDRKHCPRCGRLLSAERCDVFEGQRRVCACGEVWNVKEEIDWEAVNENDKRRIG